MLSVLRISTKQLKLPNRLSFLLRSYLRKKLKERRESTLLNAATYHMYQGRFNNSRFLNEKTWKSDKFILIETTTRTLGIVIAKFRVDCFGVHVEYQYSE